MMPANPDPELRNRYRQAWERWREALEELHSVLLDDRPMDAMHRVALLRRESHYKARYERERRAFLRLPDSSASPLPPEDTGG